MAGVGRKGFAAAARAAIFAHQMGMHADSPQSELSPLMAELPGMDGRRANAPRYLDITSATHYCMCICSIARFGQCCLTGEHCSFCRYTSALSGIDCITTFAPFSALSAIPDSCVNSFSHARRAYEHPPVCPSYSNTVALGRRRNDSTRAYHSPGTRAPEDTRAPRAGA